MSAYFSNGTEGMVLDELCARCHFGFDKDLNNRQDYPCPAWLLQITWNYEQFAREDKGYEVTQKGNVTTHYPKGDYTEVAKTKKEVLDLLLPQNDKVLCAMFVEVSDD